MFCDCTVGELRYVILTPDLSYFKVPCHHRRSWRPCDARAVCPLKPRWAVLGSRYLSSMCSGYPDISVIDVPSLSSPLLFQLPSLNSQGHALMTCPGKLSYRWRTVFISLLHICCSLYFHVRACFSSPLVISVTSPANPKFNSYYLLTFVALQKTDSPNFTSISVHTTELDAVVIALVHLSLVQSVSRLCR